jgi:hypothetical protein
MKVTFFHDSNTKGAESHHISSSLLDSLNLYIELFFAIVYLYVILLI